MAVVSIKNKLRRGNLLVGNDPYIPTDFESIATVSVGSGGAANVEFTSIPATFTHLQIRILGRSNHSGVSDTVEVQVNSDTGSNYNGHYLYGNGSSVFAGSYGATTGEMYLGGVAGATSTSGIFGATIIDILDYANTNKYKTFRGTDGVELNSTSGTMFIRSGLWRSTSAITSLKFTLDNGTAFVQYSHFALYGIKVAS
jgi:hypothetical protein